MCPSCSCASLVAYRDWPEGNSRKVPEQVDHDLEKLETQSVSFGQTPVGEDQLWRAAQVEIEKSLTLSSDAC